MAKRRLCHGNQGRLFKALAAVWGPWAARREAWRVAGRLSAETVAGAGVAVKRPEAQGLGITLEVDSDLLMGHTSQGELVRKRTDRGWHGRLGFEQLGRCY